MGEEPRKDQKIELSDIDNQSWTTLIADFLICPQCGIVDRDSSRSTIGEPCSSCGEPSDCGHLYYWSPINLLIHLLQQAYFSETAENLQRKYLPDEPSIATVLLFCTLREVMLEQFFIKLLCARKIPADIIEKLLEDNKMASQKYGGLFHSLVGKKWEQAVREVSKREGYDFKIISETMKLAVKARNDFLHKGIGKIDRELATFCVNKLYDLCYLFATLHNEFIRPYYKKKG